MALKNVLLLTIFPYALIPSVLSITLFDCKIVLLNGSNQTLTATCQSNGHNVGTYVIAPFESNNFASHVLVKQKSTASCSLKLGNLHGNFDVFDWDSDRKRCCNKVCIWNINEEGLSLLIDAADYVLQYRWQ